MVICRIETWDCRRNWRLVKTAKGYCIEFAINNRRLSSEASMEFRQLGFTIAYNKTDATYGWNGFMNGLTVYYLNINTTLQDESHSFPLIPTLTTIVTLQNVKGNTLYQFQ